MADGGRSLAGKTLFITGASRGIGKAIGLRAARDRANVVIAAKTTEAHPKLPGTVHTAAEEIEAAGGCALAVPCDIRFDDQVEAAVARAAERFGGIDILVNNASAIHLSGTLETPMKRYDLMFDVNVRGAFLCTRACLPHLRKAANPHVLNLSPPPRLAPRWVREHAAYTASKVAMSLWVLGMAEEFREAGIAFNGLWPRTVIDTAALNLLGGDAVRRRARSPAIVADAAHAILTKDSRTFTGNFCIDEEVLRVEGVIDFAAYRRPDVAEDDLLPDLFLG
ncbi:MAG TPA: NAD(P)-dependent oxidoreductase [Thermoplasmata archaeon]|nr:NAD(P)-dependent oxidoreductase [Thermoplasmata archaeon]HLE46558.1 NAD(P)-dependent oxidoreductase [Thermoplasmata archaeon]